MKYGSVCSGVEAATVAWHPLGWKPQWFSEIEKFPSAVLAHHYPDTPNHGDMTQFKEWPDDRSIDLLVGGTPCQSFSIAGLRKGLDDPRGNLMLTFLAIAERYRPRWLVWENVPGVLSSNRGKDFGTLLGAMGEIGYGFAYRICDAQYWGVPQRRRRVFVVGYLGDWRRAAAALFERHSLQGHPPPSRKARQEVAGYTATSFGRYSPGVGTIRAQGGDLGGGSETLCVTGQITHSLRGGGAGGKPDGATVNHFVPTWPAEIASTLNAAFGDKQGLEDQHINSGAPLFVPIGNVQDGSVTTLSSREYKGLSCGRDSMTSAAVVYDTTNITSPTNGSNPKPGDPVFTLASGQHPPLLTPQVRRLTPDKSKTPAVAWDEELNAREELAGTLLRGGAGGRRDGVMQASAVRRLTPVECERLQGFPDDYTQIPWRNKPAENCPDGPRYKAMGNSMAVPVMRWIGERIEMVDAL